MCKHLTLQLDGMPVLEYGYIMYDICTIYNKIKLGKV